VFAVFPQKGKALEWGKALGVEWGWERGMKMELDPCACLADCIPPKGSRKGPLSDAND